MSPDFYLSQCSGCPNRARQRHAARGYTLASHHRRDGGGNGGLVCRRAIDRARRPARAALTCKHDERVTCQGQPSLPVEHFRRASRATSTPNGGSASIAASRAETRTELPRSTPASGTPAARVDQKDPDAARITSTKRFENEADGSAPVWAVESLYRRKQRGSGDLEALQAERMPDEWSGSQHHQRARKISSAVMKPTPKSPHPAS